MGRARRDYKDHLAARSFRFQSCQFDAPNYQPKYKQQDNMATCSRLTVALFMLLAATRPAPTSAEDDDDDDLFDFQIHAMCRLRGFEKPDTPSQIINRGLV